MHGKAFCSVAVQCTGRGGGQGLRTAVLTAKQQVEKGGEPVEASYDAHTCLSTYAVSRVCLCMQESYSACVPLSPTCTGSYIWLLHLALLDLYRSWRTALVPLGPPIHAT